VIALDATSSSESMVDMLAAPGGHVESGDQRREDCLAG
jgi:hypothetical protein